MYVKKLDLKAIGRKMTRDCKGEILNFITHNHPIKNLQVAEEKMKTFIKSKVHIVTHRMDH